MTIHQSHTSRGMALIMVMVIILVLSVLAGAFAYSMKVEMHLARNHVDDTEMEWLGRSGVELARYVVGQQLNIRNEPFDALNQKWAGGYGSTNELLADISLEDNRLGNGTFSLKIVDMERKININAAAASPVLLHQACTIMGLDPTTSSTIVDSILDWIDTDDNPHLSGAESDYYLGLSPPYYAKNGPMDDISELLMVCGVNREIYYGRNNTNGMGQFVDMPMRRQALTPRDMVDQQIYDGGLVDLFTAISSGSININTAPLGVLQVLPGMDYNLAQSIIQFRSGPDGVEGTEDDTPFPNIALLQRVGGMNPQIVQQFSRFLSVRSMTFEVTVEARIGDYHRQFVSMLRRNNPRDVQILYFHWK